MPNKINFNENQFTKTKIVKDYKGDTYPRLKCFRES